MTLTSLPHTRKVFSAVAVLIAFQLSCSSPSWQDMNNTHSQTTLSVSCPENMTESREHGAIVLRDATVLVMLRHLSKRQYDQSLSRTKGNFQSLHNSGQEVFQPPEDFVTGEVLGTRFKRIDVESGKTRQVQYLLSREGSCFYAEIIGTNGTFDESIYEPLFQTVRFVRR